MTSDPTRVTVRVPLGANAPVHSGYRPSITFALRGAAMRPQAMRVPFGAWTTTARPNTSE